MKKKWKIEKLRPSKKLKRIADIILNQRVSSVLSLMKKYLDNKNVETLHDLRIGLRRVRYNLELFLVCYDESTFSKFYKKNENLQNLSGELRDLDVFLLNLKKLKEAGVIIEDLVFLKVEEKRKDYEKELNEQLTKFLKSKTLKKFLDEINLKRRTT